MNFFKSLAAGAFAIGAMVSFSAHADTVKLAVGEWAPYVGSELEGNGLHSQKVAEVFTSGGHEVAYDYSTWNRALELTKRGDMVATFPWSHTEEREADFIYPKTPIEEQKDVVFYRKDKFPDGLTITSLDDIAAQGLKVVGITGYWYNTPLADAGVDIHEVASDDLAWKFLEGGRADVFIENEVVGNLMKDKLFGDGASELAATDALRTVPMYIMFSKAHPDGAKLAEMWDANAK
ncbi:polar amino acid transport system substrate-binding protein [Roseibium hamelinense]|uniref:Polar amino acid transport system substrate-binding protein n=1 Tax=Roseibium hamelinense TaxID=150831 RepID=A0A562SXG4_9HYPH|nr:transporter substrate-binding domain-containing protein [Roseibium hamelinense]MTI44819.1 transporter substrate-binding domain-containing protein [Roseibium hamelinense]TWI85989.1 polar amino acid transport system substrate-binding protein [Roseibium hamelinense]